MNTQWRALLCECHRLSSLRHCPSRSHFVQLLFLSFLSSCFFLSALTLSPHLTLLLLSPHSLHLLLLCSPQSPPKGATIPYRPKPASTPVIFSGGQVRADPLGASTANLSLLLQHQPLPVSVAPGFTHFSPLPHSLPHPWLAWNHHCCLLCPHCHLSPAATRSRTGINSLFAESLDHRCQVFWEVGQLTF